MFFEVRAPQEEANIIPNHLLEPLLNDFGREKSIEKACREVSRATQCAQVARGATRMCGWTYNCKSGLISDL